MRSLERQGVEDRLPQKHLGPTASALERKGVSSEHGDENRKIISVNKMLARIWICEGTGAKHGIAMRRKKALSMI